MLMVTVFHDMICIEIIYMLITLCPQPVPHSLGFVLRIFICKRMPQSMNIAEFPRAGNLPVQWAEMGLEITTPARGPVSLLALTTSVLAPGYNENKLNQKGA